MSSIHLPESLMVLVRERVAMGGYASPVEYIAALIEADMTTEEPLGLTDEERKRIGDIVLERLDSGQPGIVADEAFWDALKRRIREGAPAEKANAS
jgi:Arc/MetJ-type ribon-helix-helix transcriptional regulator